MKLARTITILSALALAATLVPIGAQEPDSLLKRGPLNTSTEGANRSFHLHVAGRAGRRQPAIGRSVIPPATVFHNPEYLSGEASISVAANSNPLIRIGIAQNGVTLIEFPSADKFFAVHAGNSDLVTVEKSPSLKRDHHLVLRAGSGFLVPMARAKGPHAITPATSIIAQMDSGMAITMMIYPVPLLKQQAHRLVIKYDRDAVIAARRAAGLATSLVGLEVEAVSDTAATIPAQSADSVAAPDSPDTDTSKRRNSSNEVGSGVDFVKRERPDYKNDLEAALSEAVKNPKLFKKWTEPRHSLRISTLPPRELNATTRLVVFAVRNLGPDPLRLISGYPDLYVETLNEKGRPVEAGTRVEKVNLVSSGNENLLSAGETLYFALAYEAPILGAQQHLKVVVAQMNAADEPAMADLTALAR